MGEKWTAKSGGALHDEVDLYRDGECVVDGIWFGDKEEAKSFCDALNAQVDVEGLRDVIKDILENHKSQILTLGMRGVVLNDLMAAIRKAMGGTDEART